MKDPAFLFYPGDWLGGTMGMTFEEKGAYFELLIFQFNNGPFTEAQAKQVLSICSASVWHTLSIKFAKTGDKYFNKRLDDEIRKRKNFSESRRKNAKGLKSKNNPPKNEKAYAKHMENENINENENSNKKEPTSKLDIFEQIFTDEIYINDLSITHKGKDLKQAFEECYSHHSVSPRPPTELWEWKQKLNTWLTIKQVNKNGNSKKQDRERTIAESIAARYGADSPNQGHE